jgi:hypothetical protein
VGYRRGKGDRARSSSPRSPASRLRIRWINAGNVGASALFGSLAFSLLAALHVTNRVRSTAKDGGRRLFCVAMQSALQGAAENSRRPPLQHANRLPSDRPLEGRARPLPTREQSPRADALDSESEARSHRADLGCSN